MNDDPVKGGLLTLAAVVTLLVAAWWVGDIAPVEGVGRLAAVPIALLLSIYLHQGYRGFRWIVAGLLFAAGASAAYRIVAAWPWPGAGGVVGRALLAAVTLGMGWVLVRSDPVRAFLASQREGRSEHTAILLIIVWIVFLAVMSVWLWITVLAQVL